MSNPEITKITSGSLVECGADFSPEDASAGVLPIAVFEGIVKRLEESGTQTEIWKYYDREFESWNIPCWSLGELRQESDDQVVEHYLKVYGDFQELALLWPILEGMSMNGHGSEHIKVVWNDARNLLNLAKIFNPEDRKKVALAVAFHDSGMALAGRETHESSSIQFMEAVFGEEIFRHDVGKEAASLVSSHTTNIATETLVEDNPLLAILILADEAHLENRVTHQFDTEDFYRYDPWIRVSKHVVNSEFELLEGEISTSNEKQNNKLVWIIETDNKEAQSYLDQGLDSSLLEDLDLVVFSKKAELYLACVKSAFGSETDFAVRINEVTYGVDEDGLVVESLRREMEDYEQSA